MKGLNWSTVAFIAVPALAIYAVTKVGDRMTATLLAWLVAAVMVVTVLYVLLYFAEIRIGPGWLLTRLDRWMGREAENSKMKGLVADVISERMEQVLHGQPHIVEAVTAITRIRLQVQRHDKTYFSLLVGGEPGTGRSTVGKAIARSLYNTEDCEPHVVLIDCERLKAKGSLEALNDMVKSRLNSEDELVILIDKVEHALKSQDPDIDFGAALADLVEYGTVDGCRVANRAVVIVTTGLFDGADTVTAHNGDYEAISAALKKRLANQGTSLPKRFLNHVSAVTSTVPLSTAALQSVLLDVLSDIVYDKFGLEVENVDGAVLGHCGQAWRTLSDEGAKAAIRWIEGRLEKGLALAKEQGAKKVDLTWNESGPEGGIEAHIREIAAPATASTVPAAQARRAAPATASQSASKGSLI